MATDNDKKRVLVIGAGGFIGGFIAAEGLRRGYDVWAGVRRSTSLRYLDDKRLHILHLDYDNPAALRQQLQEALPQGQAWDYVIHNLGVTKCVDPADFDRINCGYLQAVVEALKATGKTPAKFLMMSSLSALGPGDERHYTPLTDDMPPHPDTRYGLSKIKAEQYLELAGEIPYVIFRATGVYGPHEQDYLMMIKSIAAGWDWGVGMRRQLLTFIYVDDLVGAMYDALAADAAVGRRYIIAEERAYTQREFRTMVAQALGRRHVIPVRLPMSLVWVASAVAQWVGKLRGKPSTLNLDKWRIMRQRNWSADVTPARRDFDFKTRYPLERGIRETVAAFKASRDTSKGSKAV